MTTVFSALSSLTVVVILVFMVTTLANATIDDDGPADPSSPAEEDGNDAAGNNDEMNTDDDNSCSADYAIIDGWTTCCNHTITLKHGIDAGKFWKDCAKRPPPPPSPTVAKGKKTKTKTDQESYVNATRRVYACILQKYLNKSAMSLVNFAKLMTTTYPDGVRSKIMNQAKSHSLQKQKETSLSNYEGIREIRNAFFEIQKRVCIALDPTTTTSPSKETEKTSESSTKNCQQWEEAEKNGGTCCKNYSVPLDLWYTPISQEHPPSCNDTLTDLFKKWEIQEQSEIEAALEICSDACKLRQQKVISSNNLEMMMHVRTRKELLKQIRQIAPPYLSQTVLQDLLTYSSAHNDTSVLEGYYSKMYHLTNDTIKALRPCIVTQRLTEIVYDGLYSHCFPPNADRPQVKQ